MGLKNLSSAYESIRGMCFVIAALTAACSPELTKLDEKAVHQFLNEAMSAVAKMDADAVCAKFAEHAEFRMVQIRFSGSEIQTLSKAEYCEQLRPAYQQLKGSGMAQSTSLNVESIEIAPDGKSAELKVKVTESMSVMGQTVTQQSDQSATLELVDGKPKYTRVTARTSSDR